MVAAARRGQVRFIAACSYSKSFLKQRCVKVKELQKRCIIKAFKLSYQEKYEHVSSKVTSTQDDKDYKMAKRDYAWSMISRRKEIVDIAAKTPSAYTIVPGIFKLDLGPLAPRITSANIVPPKKSTSYSVETQKPELKVYSRKPKNVGYPDCSLVSGLVPTLFLQHNNLYSTTVRDDWDCFLQPMFDEYFTSSSIVVSPVQEATALRGFKESPKTPSFHDDPLHESLHEDSTPHGSSSNATVSVHKSSIRFTINKKKVYLGIIYVDLYKRKRLMRVDELYKFSDGTLNDVRSALHDITCRNKNVIPAMRKLSNLETKKMALDYGFNKTSIFIIEVEAELEKLVVEGENGNDLRALNINTTQAQQKALDDTLVAPAHRLKFGKCNMRLKTDIKQKEATFQVVLDALALTPFYQAFLITADRKRLMRVDELYKFSDGTLNDVRSALHDIAEGIRIHAALSEEVDAESREVRCQNRRDLPRDIPLDSVVVLRYEKRSKSENKGKVPTEMELVLEQTQQGTSYEVSPPIFYDDDDEESSIPLRDFISELPLSVAITPDLPITDTLIMEDDHLNTILETEWDEENESSVKDLNLTPSESEDLSEDLSDNESECDMPDDESFSKEDVPKENFKIYSNPLFEFDEETISSKIDPLYNEIDSIPQGNDNDHFNAESDLIESLLNRDTLMVSFPKIDSLLEEFSSELAHIDLIPPGIDEADFDPEDDIRLVKKLLYDNSSLRPPKEFNSEIPDAIIESFSPSPIPVEDRDSLMEEIDIFIALDDSMPPGIENDDYDSEGDVLFLEKLLNDYSISLPKYESFHVDFYNVPSSPRPPEKPPDDDVYFDIEPNTGVLTTKVVDDIFDNSIRELSVHVHNALLTFPTLYPVLDTLLPFSSKNENKVFNHGILISKEEKSPYLLYHRGFKVFQLINDSEIPTMIYGGDIPILDVPYLHLYPP
ncbi:hypothetical protein Tco_0109069 [Tanacetum coccineum]